MANILTSYYRPKPGGFCTRLFRAIEALLDGGHTVHYLAVAPFPVDHPKCHFHRFPWPAEKTDGLFFWGCYFLLAPWLLMGIGFQYRITHLFAFGHTYALLLQPLKILRKLPLAVFMRADSIENHKLKGRARWLWRLDLWLEGLAIYDAALYGVSLSLVQTIVSRHKRLRPRLSALLRNDIQPATSDNGEKESAPFVRMACVGILEKRKNQTFLLEIMKGIHKDEARLFIYGQGPLEADLRQQLNTLEMADRVFLMGWVDRESLWPQVDLLLMPSLHEGAPNAVLEALARDIPVLASDIPEHREILPPSCLISMADPSSWARQINRVFIDPENRLGELIVRQQPYVKELTFDWDKEVCNDIVNN